MSVPPRILMVNLHSDRNAGDAALTQCALRQLRHSFPGCRITLSTNDPGLPAGEAAPDLSAVTSFMGSFKRPAPGGGSRWDHGLTARLALGAAVAAAAHRISGRRALRLVPPAQRGLLQACLEADLVVSCAGGYLYSVSGLALSYGALLYPLFLAILAGKPLYLLPQSIGPFRLGWERAATRWVLNRARLVMAREEVSARALADIGVRERVRLLPDLAFGFPAGPAGSAVAWLRGLGIDPARDRPLLGITSLDWGAQNRAFDRQTAYESAMAAAAASFLERHPGGKAVFFPQSTGPSAAEDDRHASRRIAQLVAERLAGAAGRAVVVQEAVAPPLLKAAFGRMDVFLGTRMHSVIFALAEGVPSLAVGYLHKSQGIMRMAGQAERLADIRGVDGPGLARQLEAVWSEREAIRGALQEAAPRLAAEAGSAGALIAADYAALPGRRSRG